MEQEEKYEEAAKIRDEIAAIRQKIAGNQLIVPGGEVLHPSLFFAIIFLILICIYLSFNRSD